MVKWVKGKRLPSSVFKLPVRKIKAGWYSDKYFVRTKQVLKRDRNHSRILMQIFTRKPGYACGIDEAIAVLKLCADRPRRLKIKALFDGDKIRSMETVMTIEGDYSTFAHLETVYLGIIARRSAICTSVKKVVDAAWPRKVLFFPARFDHFSVQTGDGYAAFISGALGVSTDANAAWWGAKGMGTVPHGVIAAYGGDTVKACLAFDKHLPKNIKRVALVDFENHSVKTSLDVAHTLRKRLYAVRLDTANDIADKSSKRKDRDFRGVTPELVRNVRSALDRDGFRYVRIIISCGFDEGKIKRFKRLKVPFDMVGVGSALFRDKMDFTADVVLREGKPCAKVGRKYNPNPRLKEIK